MRVLWLTNHACSAMELIYPGNTRGGWLVSLEKELSFHDGIDLHVGFFYKGRLTSFQLDRTTFHSLEFTSGKSKIERYLNKFFANDLDEQKDIEKILIRKIFV